MKLIKKDFLMLLINELFERIALFIVLCILTRRLLRRFNKGMIIR